MKLGMMDFVGCQFKIFLNWKTLLNHLGIDLNFVEHALSLRLQEYFAGFYNIREEKDREM